MNKNTCVNCKHFQSMDERFSSNDPLGQCVGDNEAKYLQIYTPGFGCTYFKSNEEANERRELSRAEVEVILAVAEGKKFLINERYEVYNPKLPALMGENATTDIYMLLNNVLDEDGDAVFMDVKWDEVINPHINSGGELVFDVEDESGDVEDREQWTITASMTSEINFHDVLPAEEK